METKSKVEINFQFKRSNGVRSSKKVEVIIPQNLERKLTGGNKNINELIPYISGFLNKGEQADYYTKKTLIKDVDLENRKIEEQQKKELIKQKEKELKQRKESERLLKLQESKHKSESTIIDLEDDIQDDYKQKLIIDKSEKREPSKKSGEKDRLKNINISESEKSESSEGEKTKKSYSKKDITNEPNHSSTFSSKKEKIDLAYYEKLKKLELKNQLKNQKIENAKKILENGGNKYFYYVKRFWIFLDKPWKKIVFCLFIFYSLIYLNEYFTQTSDKKVLLAANAEFLQYYNIAQKELSTNNKDKARSLLTKLDSIKTHFYISNEFIIDEKKQIEEDWENKISELDNSLNQK